MEFTIKTLISRRRKFERDHGPKHVCRGKQNVRGPTISGRGGVRRKALKVTDGQNHLLVQAVGSARIIRINSNRLKRLNLETLFHVYPLFESSRFLAIQVVGCLLDFCNLDVRNAC